MRRAVWLVFALGCSGRFWAVTSGTYACEAAVAENTCGTSAVGGAQEVEVQGGGTAVMSLLAPVEGSIRGPVLWGSVQFGAQADPEVYTTTGGFSCNGGWVEASQRATLTSVGTGRLALRVAWTYGAGAPSCGVVAGCRLTYDVTCTRLR
ncbi:MAG: hypothetical protein U0325_06150 [Polyangiales bacterium]